MNEPYPSVSTLSRPSSRRLPAVVAPPPGLSSHASPVFDEDALARAVDSGKDMRIVLQPQYDLRTGALVGAESLIRWRPGASDVSPGHFIPAVQRLGKKSRLLQFVFGQIRRLLRRLGRNGPALPISANASVSTLSTPGLIRALHDSLRRDGISPRLVKIEITEQLDLHDMHALAADLQWMREQGFGVSMDDFGTGTSTLERLTQLPFSELKIDRSFVQRMLSEPATHAVVRATLELGQRLGMDVVAEGIENKDQLAVLKVLGCRIGQGYALSRPLEVDAFIRLASRPPPVRPPG